MGKRDRTTASAEPASTLAGASRWAGKVLVVMVVVAVHVGVLRVAEASAPVIVALAVYLVPSIVTLACRKQARSHWWLLSPCSGWTT